MSILDFRQKSLCPDIWDTTTNKLLPEVKIFIFKAIRSFFDEQDLSEYKNFIVDVVIGSSLATQYYRIDTDMDVKIILDAKAILSKRRLDHIDPEELALFMTKEGRKDHYLTMNIPGTIHPIDAYFYDVEDFYPINYNKYDSLYSLKLDSWLEEPNLDDGFVNPQAILNIAIDKAQPYLDLIVSDISKAKRDVIDLIMFRDYLSTLDQDDRSQIKEFFTQKFEETNNSINDLIADKQDLKFLRTEAFSKDSLESELEKVMHSFNYSDENLVFKVVQRYGYMRLLKEIEDLYERSGIDENNIDDYCNILTI